MKKTERLIFDSFLSLFSTRDYSSITITMLCDKAGVGRATFYRHYKDLDDVFDFIVDTFILDFKNEVLPIFISEDYEVKKDKIRQFFQGMSHHRQIQNVLSNNVSLFIEKITKRIADNIIESNTLKDYAF
ncbi:MAG: TetR/AcrR family transcriptional regulator, partial [Bacilli bacterium]